MFDFSLSYYFCLDENNGEDGYILLNLYEIVNTLTGPVISSNYSILFYYCDEYNYLYDENIFEINNIIDDSIETIDNVINNPLVIEISEPVFKNFKEKFTTIIKLGSNIDYRDNNTTYNTIKNTINNFKDYLSKIGLIKKEHED